MEKIEKKELYDLLNSTNNVEFKIISLPEIDLKDLSNISFIDCIFISNIIFQDTSQDETKLKKSILLNNCGFKNINFLECDFSIFEIKNILTLNALEINNCKIDFFRILDSHNLDCKITLRNNVFCDVFTFENNHFINGSLSFLKNEFTKETIIQKNTFSTLRFVFVKFNEFLAIVKNEFINNQGESSFFDCVFEQFNFSGNDVRLIHFIDCKFFGITLFRDTPYNIFGIVKFNDCFIHKNIQFNKSSFHNLSIDNVIFEQTASFQDVFCDTINIDQTVFEKIALFDDIQIKKIYECDRRTIRTIKLQLQKAENKIDYNKFRVYEFNAYREDIKNKLKKIGADENRFFHRHREPFQLKRDSFVLWISDVVSEYGTDWKRALKFTLFWGFIIYFLFYIIENYNHTVDITNWDNWKRFVSGLFRFFLVTDFYNPLETDRVYLTNPLSWLIFIFGKIVIAFGIYEMIQSFRKFKA